MENKPILKVKEIINYQVYYCELEEFIKNIYGVEKYELIASEECNNNSYIKSNVTKKELDEWDTNELNRFVESKGVKYCPIHTILNDLCNKELIQSGEYLIEISW